MDKQQRPSAVRIAVPEELMEHAIILGFSAAVGMTTTGDGLRSMVAIERSPRLCARAARSILRHLQREMASHQPPNEARYLELIAELTAIPKES